MTKKPAKTQIKQRQTKQPFQSAGLASQKQLSVLPAFEWSILLSPFLFGLFFPSGSSVISIVLTALCFLLVSQNQLRTTKSLVFLTAVSVVVFHLGGALWGMDRGMALFGALQFLPLPLFVLFLEQYSPESPS